MPRVSGNQGGDEDDCLHKYTMDGCLEMDQVKMLACDEDFCNSTLLFLEFLVLSLIKKQGDKRCLVCPKDSVSCLGRFLDGLALKTDQKLKSTP